MWLRLFIVVCSEKPMNTCLWHSDFCCSNIVVIVGVSFASTVCPIQYTVDLTSVCQKFVMSVIHYSFETLPHTSALNRHIHQTNFLMWRFITVLQKVSLSSFVLYIYIYVLSILNYHYLHLFIFSVSLWQLVMYYVIFPYGSEVWTTSLDECIVPDAFLLKHG